MHFSADHLLTLSWAVGDEVPKGLTVDLEQACVVASTLAPKGAGEFLTEHRFENQVARMVPGEEGVGHELVLAGRVTTLVGAGKHPYFRWADDGGSLFSRARSGEVLNRWNVKVMKAQKFKCFDRATLVACTPTLVAAHNKEGVVSFFDARKPKRLVSVRPTPSGWLAFDDTGAWDASDGFTRGVELSWSDAKSTAFVPGVGFGWLELNAFPLTRVVASTGMRTPGLLALKTSGRW